MDLLSVGFAAVPNGYDLREYTRGMNLGKSLANLATAPVRVGLAAADAGLGVATSALGLALDTSQRTVQRALDSLAAAGKVQSFGHGRARRWMTPPVPGFTTTLLLPAPLPSD